MTETPTEHPGYIADESPAIDAPRYIERGRASARKRTRTLADRVAQDLDRLADAVAAEQRIADLEEQLRTERARLNSAGRTDIDDPRED